MGGWYIAQGCIINPFLKTERRTETFRMAMGTYQSATRRHGRPCSRTPDKLGMYFAVLTVFGPSTKGTANSCPASPKLRINHVNT